MISKFLSSRLYSGIRSVSRYRQSPIHRRDYCWSSAGATASFLRSEEIHKLPNFDFADERISHLLRRFRNEYDRGVSDEKKATQSVDLPTDDQMTFLQRLISIDDQIADIDRQIDELRRDFPTAECSSSVEGTEQIIATTDSELAKLVQEDLENFENDRSRLRANLLSELGAWLLCGRNNTTNAATMKYAEEDTPRDLILEVSAGVGGQEAMLFTREIFDMYRRYATFRNWKFYVLEERATDLDGLHFAAAAIGGENAYAMLRFEGGVHRVQRVPATERNGRVHTSTMSVAVLAQPGCGDDGDPKPLLNPKELRFESFRASAPGGQNVNKSDTGCRIIHLPTGITVSCQMERYAHVNREWALRRLSAILYDRKVDAQRGVTQRARKLQVGSLARSEKIRTYNYPQDRITDHRTKHTFVGIPDTLAGAEGLDRITQSVLRFHLEERLSEALDEEMASSSSNVVSGGEENDVPVMKNSNSR